MSGWQRISVPSVIINNETLAIVPGSLSYKGGALKTSVSALSVGGGKVKAIHALDAEGAVGMVKFKLALTTDVDAKIADWSENTASNAISFVQKIGTKNAKRTFTNMSLVEDPERTTGSEGEVELEFQGDQMS